MRLIRALLFVSFAVVILSDVSVSAISWPYVEGEAHGFPVLRDANGAHLADGDFVQWVENGLLHVRIVYTFPRGRRVEEQAVLRQRPELSQEKWSWKETRDGKVSRQFDVDFGSGLAVAVVPGDKGQERMEDTLEVTKGRTFAGFGFSLVAKALREQLIRGEQVTLDTVGFTPKPRKVSVTLSYGGRDRIRMSTRTIAADRFVVHPQIPIVAKLFVHVPDATIWLTQPPAGFVRMEAPLMEPSDPMVRVDLLPGDPSGPAVPVGTSGQAPSKR